MDNTTSSSVERTSLSFQVIPTNTLCFVIAMVWLCRSLFLAFSRAFRNHLTSFPGPRVAAITRFYQAYYDLWRDGDFVHHLHRLHEEYGPVVRIGPNELHFNNIDAYRDIYQVPSTFLKDESYDAANQSDSSFGARDTIFHRRRRDNLGPMLSRRAILEIESNIQHKMNLLTQKLMSYKTVDLHKAFLSFTLDTIWSYAYGEDDNALDFPEFSHPVVIALSRGRVANQIATYCPSLLAPLKLLPTCIRNRVLPEGYVHMMKVLERHANSLEKAARDSKESDKRKTIFSRLCGLESPSRISLIHEGLNLTIAGADTVANACVVGFFHVHHNPDLLSRLREELCSIWPDPQANLPYETLEKLPYLTAVIKESLRLSHGVPVGLRRVVQPGSTKISEFMVPEGTTVSVGATFLHWNKDIFPNPLQFSPDRWLHDAEKLDPYLVPFSRGPRQCLGINLSWCELYLIFGHIFRKLDLQLDKNMTLEDVQDVRCHFIPIIGRRKPLQVMVRGELKC